MKFGTLIELNVLYHLQLAASKKDTPVKVNAQKMSGVQWTPKNH